MMMNISAAPKWIQRTGAILAGAGMTFALNTPMAMAKVDSFVPRVEQLVADASISVPKAVCVRSDKSVAGEGIPFLGETVDETNKNIKVLVDDCTNTLQADKQQGVGNGSGWLVRTKEAVKNYIEPTKANTLKVIGATSATVATVPKALPLPAKPNEIVPANRTTTGEKPIKANIAASDTSYNIDYLKLGKKSTDYFITTYGGNQVLVSTTPKQALAACYAPETTHSKTQKLQSVAAIPARLAGASEELMRDPNNNVNGITKFVNDCQAKENHTLVTTRKMPVAVQLPDGKTTTTYALRTEIPNTVEGIVWLKKQKVSPININTYQAPSRAEINTKNN